jgi:hypothetical protein
MRIKDEDGVIGPGNSKIVLEFHKKEIGSSEQNTELTYLRKLVLGNCKLLDPKSEKPFTYEFQITVQ